MYFANIYFSILFFYVKLFVYVWNLFLFFKRRIWILLSLKLVHSLLIFVLRFESLFQPKKGEKSHLTYVLIYLMNWWQLNCEDMYMQVWHFTYDFIMLFHVLYHVISYVYIILLHMFISCHFICLYYVIHMIYFVISYHIMSVWSYVMICWIFLCLFNILESHCKFLHYGLKWYIPERSLE